MIHFEKVDFSYHSKVKLLSDVDLALKPGHIHGLLGKNGEGKSTLLKLMAGLLFPQKGKMEVMGFVPRKRNPEMLCDIYFLPESGLFVCYRIPAYLGHSTWLCDTSSLESNTLLYCTILSCFGASLFLDSKLFPFNRKTNISHGI